MRTQRAKTHAADLGYMLSTANDGEQTNLEEQDEEMEQDENVKSGSESRRLARPVHQDDVSSCRHSTP